jgi:hypothetical protein
MGTNVFNLTLIYFQIFIKKSRIVNFSQFKRFYYIRIYRLILCITNNHTLVFFMRGEVFFEYFKAYRLLPIVLIRYFVSQKSEYIYEEIDSKKKKGVDYELK